MRSFQTFTLLGLLLVVSGHLPVGATRRLSATKVKSGFLQSLPLTITLTTPEELASGGITYVSGRQALTVVFARPVIALGSDFNSAVSKKVPFRLTCGVPGKLRWVTTTIARFDPDVDWPTDLSCSLRWNTRLTTYDGMPLQLGNITASRPIESYSMAMSMGDVYSERAANVTGGLWSATSGAPGDKLPEVPPDGRITVYTNYTVNLALLATSLKLVEGTSSDGSLNRSARSLPFTVRPCFTPVDYTPGGGVISLDINTTCVEVEVGPSLKPDTWYTLLLPSGSKYFAMSGELGWDQSVTFAGLRRFRIPFLSDLPKDDDRAGLSFSYRRLDMWLPHGLAPGTSPAALARCIRLCERPTDGRQSSSASTCTDLPFSLALVDRARARLTAPGLQPGKLYRVLVSADATLVDGFGMTLEASATEIGMSYVPYVFASPALPSLAVLEAGADNLTGLPYITRAPPPTADRWPPGYIRNLTMFSLNVGKEGDRMQLLRFIKEYSYDPLSYFSSPSTVVAVPANLTTPGSGAGWTEVRLPLGPAQLQVAYSCCTPEYFSFSQTTQVLLKTSLSVSVVQSGPKLVAWVTDAVLGGGSGPVAGATVDFYGLPYFKKEPYKAFSCRTNSAGVCTVEPPSSFNKFGDRMTTVVRAPAAAGATGGAATEERFALLPDNGYFQSAALPSYYYGTTVVDRKLVKPGDSLKVTGYVQLATPSGLKRPPTSYAVLQVQPSWKTGGYYDDLPSFVVKVNSTTGSFHAELPVPADALPASYTLSLLMSEPPATQPPTLSGGYLWDWHSLTYTSFVLGDPRPPTAELLVSVPPWVLPNGTIHVNATAVSYIGASVAGAAITATYNIAGKTRLLTLRTDAAGFASGSVDLGALTAAERAQLYGNLGFQFEWVGPTREKIFKSASVRIAGGPAELSLSRSLPTDLPGTAFSVAAALTSVVDGAAIDSVPVTLTLRPDPESPAAGATCNTSVTCTTSSGVTWKDPAPAGTLCRFALPCVGRFILEGCADVPYDNGSGKTVRMCSQQTLGRNLTDWAVAPLSGHLTISLALDKPGGYKLGETPQVVFENPFSRARLLLVWGTDFAVKYKVVSASELPAGAIARVPLEPLGEECRTVCYLQAVLDVPRVGSGDLPALPPATQLPVSRVFDPRAPHTVLMSVVINVVPDNALAVGVEVAPAAGSTTTTVQDASGGAVLAVEPGASAQITVSVGAAASDGPVEVTVYAVDKAFLDLVPYDLPQPQQQMLLYLQASMNVYNLGNYRVVPGAIRAVYDKLLARLTQIDPWLPVDTSLAGGPVDEPDDVYVSRYTSAITYMAGQWNGSPWHYDPSDGSWIDSGRMPPLNPSFARPPPPPGRNPDHSNPADKGDGNSNSDFSAPDSGTSGLLRRAADFVVTPLFKHVLTGSDGRARFNFTAPSNLGTFVIRAFAAAGATAKYGAGEGKVVVRRTLSLTPSVPRFVRVGDVFEAGVVVTVGSAPATVAVSLLVLNSSDSPVTATGAIAKSFTFVAGEDLQEEIRFSFSAVAVGTAAVVISAHDTSPGGSLDSLELELPVYGQQGDVWAATSFALAANASVVQWQEGMELPAAVPGSGGLMLTAGVGYLPAINSLYDNLLVADGDREEAYAPPALLWATLPAVLSYYAQAPSGPQPDKVAKGFSDLTRLTDGYLGLKWWDPLKWSSWYPSRVDMYLNTWAVFVVRTHAAAAAASSLPPPWSSSWSSLLAEWGEVASWGAALQRQLLHDVVEARELYNMTYSDWYTLAWVRLSLGADWSPGPNDTDNTTRATVSLGRMLAAYHDPATREEFGRETRVVLSLALLGLGAANPDPAFVAATVSEVTSALRVQGRTVYVASGPGSASAASLDDQALCLLLLLRAGATHQLLPKLAAYVASPTASGGGGFFYYYASWTAQALAIAAVTEYDRAKGSARPNVDLLADADGLAVLKASFRANRTQPVTNTTAWEDLPPPPGAGERGHLNFQINGTGEVSVAASLHFVPSALPTFPTYRGLYVESILQLVDPLTGRPTGRRLASVPLGSTVALSVQLTSPDDLGAVTLSVMMPGGLEPLDPNLFGSNAGSSCFLDFMGGYSSGYSGRGISSWWWWWWPVCPAQETRPALVKFTYAALRAGTASVTINAVAASAGTFVVPPIRASVDEQPEVMGMTAAGTVSVCADCEGPTYAPAPPAPKACPGECSDSGVCNLLTGTCLCDPGFTGPDCSTAAGAAH